MSHSAARRKVNENRTGCTKRRKRGERHQKTRPMGMLRMMHMVKRWRMKKMKKTKQAVKSTVKDKRDLPVKRTKKVMLRIRDPSARRPMEPKRERSEA